MVDVTQPSLSETAMVPAHVCTHTCTHAHAHTHRHTHRLPVPSAALPNTEALHAGSTRITRHRVAQEPGALSLVQGVLQAPWQAAPSVPAAPLTVQCPRPSFPCMKAHITCRPLTAAPQASSLGSWRSQTSWVEPSTRKTAPHGLVDRSYRPPCLSLSLARVCLVRPGVLAPSDTDTIASR